jgi:hypothetical protein
MYHLPAQVQVAREDVVQIQLAGDRLEGEVRTSKPPGRPVGHDDQPVEVEPRETGRQLLRQSLAEVHVVVVLARHIKGHHGETGGPARLWCLRNAVAADRRGKPKAASRHCLYEMFAAATEDLPQDVDATRETGVGDRAGWPHFRHQIVLGDDTAGVLDQCLERGHFLGSEVNRPARAAQDIADLQAPRAELVPVASRHGPLTPSRFHQTRIAPPRE